MFNRLLLLTIPTGCVLLFVGIAALFDVRVLLGALAIMFIFAGTFLVILGMTIAKWKHKLDNFKSKWFGGNFLKK